MISQKILPAHILTEYVWQLLKQEGALTTVNGLVPIVPFEDEPKLADADKPYAIYGYAENISNNVEEIREGVYSLRISAPKVSQLVHITNVLGAAFESSNVATEAVNRWSGTAFNGAFIGIRFTRIRVTYIDGGDPADSEGGPIDGSVTIDYRYVHHLDTPMLLESRGGLWTGPKPETSP